MIGKKTAAFIHASRFLNALAIGSWLGSTVLITLAFTLLNLWQHQSRIVRDGEQAAHLISAVLMTPLSWQQRQQLVEAYGQSIPEHRVEGMNVVLVVDRGGSIMLSSRPTWQQLRIDDPLFDRMEGDDDDFRDIVACFHRRKFDCVETQSVDWHVHLGGITVVRPVWMPAMDLGLPRQPFLVLINFDGGLLMAEMLQDTPWLILLAMLVSSLIIGVLWFLLSARLLPELLEITHTDALTQLMNRTSFMELAMDQLAEAEESRAELVFAILDIDEFKQINDTYGHGCGDEALASVGALLLMVNRPADLVCRFGGEEFAILLVASRDSASKQLERLRLQLEMNTLHYNGHRLPLTASIGAAATSECGYNLDFLYNSADRALYAAKSRGRNRLEWNSGELLTRLPALPVSTIA